MTLDYQAPQNDQKIYRVGTLRYTFAGLVTVFFWLLFGDFTLTVMESVMPAILPLTLRDHQASNQTIGILTTTIGAAMNMIITPVVSYRSDRHRSRLGRRIPYLLWPTPLISVFLIVVGFSENIGAWVHNAVASRISGDLSMSTTILITIGVATVLFQYFNLFVTSVYYYLFNDVVPEQFMGRFYGLFRLVGAAGGFAFNLLIFPYAENVEYRKWIYVGAGVFYCAAFMLMCWKVREGEYPPPDVPKGAGFWISIKTYFRECYALSFYWWFYIGTALYMMGNVCYQTFRVFFSEEVGMDKAELGRLMAGTQVVGLVLFVPLGWVADKIHPLRLYIIAVVMVTLAMLGSIWGIHDKQTFWIFTMLWAVGHTTFAAANAPLDPYMLPKEQFGQFASASAIVRALAMMLAGWMGGKFIDLVKEYNPAIGFRVIFWWASFFIGISLVFMALVYRGWKRYGGDQDYVAPVVEPLAPGFEPVPVRADRMSKENEREPENP